MALLPFLLLFLMGPIWAQIIGSSVVTSVSIIDDAQTTPGTTESDKGLLSVIATLKSIVEEEQLRHNESRPVSTSNPVQATDESPPTAKKGSVDDDEAEDLVHVTLVPPTTTTDPPPKTSINESETSKEVTAAIHKLSGVLLSPGKPAGGQQIEAIVADVLNSINDARNSTLLGTPKPEVKLTTARATVRTEVPLRQKDQPKPTVRPKPVVLTTAQSQNVRFTSRASSPRPTTTNSIIAVNNEDSIETETEEIFESRPKPTKVPLLYFTSNKNNSTTNSNRPTDFYDDEIFGYDPYQTFLHGVYVPVVELDLAGNPIKANLVDLFSNKVTTDGQGTTCKPSEPIKKTSTQLRPHIGGFQLSSTRRPFPVLPDNLHRPRPSHLQYQHGAADTTDPETGLLSNNSPHPSELFGNPEHHLSPDRFQSIPRPLVPKPVVQNLSNNHYNHHHGDHHGSHHGSHHGGHHESQAHGDHHKDTHHHEHENDHNHGHGGHHGNDHHGSHHGNDHHGNGHHGANHGNDHHGSNQHTNDHHGTNHHGNDHHGSHHGGQNHGSDNHHHVDKHEHGHDHGHGDHGHGDHGHGSHGNGNDHGHGGHNGHHGHHVSSGKRPSFPEIPGNPGLEATVTSVDPEMSAFVHINNRLALRLLSSLSNPISKSTSSYENLVLSPFAIISSLSMMFLGARGPTAAQIDGLLQIDDMITFNPHMLYHNVTQSFLSQPNTAAAMIRLLIADKSKGDVLEFFKTRVQHFYDARVEEADYKFAGHLAQSIINQMTRAQIQRHSYEMLNYSLPLKGPLSLITASFFDGQFAGARDPSSTSLNFIHLAALGRRLITVPALGLKGAFRATYDKELDATGVEVPYQSRELSLILLMPGRPGEFAIGGVNSLKSRLTLETWKGFMRGFFPREPFKIVMPRFKTQSSFNISYALERFGLTDLFSPHLAKFKGINGGRDLYMDQNVMHFSEFGTWEKLSDSHTETTGVASKNLDLVRILRPNIRDQYGSQGEPLSVNDWIFLSRSPSQLNKRKAMGNRDLPGKLPYHFASYTRVRSSRSEPYHGLLRNRYVSRQVEEETVLKLERPFLYFLRHNPTGMIIMSGQYTEPITSTSNE